MQELVTYIVKSLVDKPDQVELRVTEQDGGTLFELKVAPDDVGKVIGRDGRTVNALRTLLAAAAQKKGAKARLEILDDRRNARAQQQPAAEAAPSAQTVGGEVPPATGQ